MLNRVSAESLGVQQPAQAADQDQGPGLRAGLMGDAAKRQVIDAALWFGRLMTVCLKLPKGPRKIF